MTSPDPPARYYQHSGQVPLFTAILSAITGLTVAALLGLLYGPLQFYLQLIPHSKARAGFVLLLLFCFGMAIGAAAGWLFTFFKGRSLKASALLAALASAAAYYFAWAGWCAAWLDHIHKPASLATLLDPSILAAYLSILYDKGFFPFVGTPTTGPMLGAAWLAEFAGLLIAAIYYARKMNNARVFCETCNRWGTKRQLMKLQTPSPAAIEKLTRALRHGDMAAFAAVAKPTLEKLGLAVSLEGCPTCDNLQSLTLISTLQTSSKSRSTTESILMRRLLLTPPQTAALIQIAASTLTP